MSIMQSFDVELRAKFVGGGGETDREPQKINVMLLVRLMHPCMHCVPKPPGKAEGTSINPYFR
jgi:hypothetical protein